MIIEAEEIRTDNYVEVKKVMEIRSGRNLMCRKITMDGTPSDGNHITILFVHGSCAASNQFDGLLECLSKINSTPGTKSAKTIDCFLYDQLGCGDSRHRPDDWCAFSAAEHNDDLHTIVTSIIDYANHKDSKFYIAAHSYGVSQTIKLLQSLDQEKSSRVEGAILMSGGLKGSSSNLTKDGGHWIFQVMPMFMLRFMQAGLSQSFVDAAIHPSKSKLKEAALENSNRNDMAMCKAFYRQQQYATSEEAQALRVSYM